MYKNGNKGDLFGDCTALFDLDLAHLAIVDEYHHCSGL